MVLYMDKLEGNYLTLYGVATLRCSKDRRDATGVFSIEKIECNKCGGIYINRDIYETTHGVEISCPGSECEAVDFFRRDGIQLSTSL